MSKVLEIHNAIKNNEPKEFIADEMLEYLKFLANILDNNV